MKKILTSILFLSFIFGFIAADASLNTSQATLKNRITGLTLVPVPTVTLSDGQIFKFETVTNSVTVSAPATIVDGQIPLQMALGNKILRIPQSCKVKLLSGQTLVFLGKVVITDKGIDIPDLNCQIQ
jgi:hypothetical protein